ncbi:hypothetical protein ACFL0X_00180 [Nanoarchaeota archaeon]
MRFKFCIFVLILIFILPNTIAILGGDDEDFDEASEGVEESFKGLFEEDPEKALEHIQNNPDLLENEVILELALNEDGVFVGSLIDDDISLLDDEVIFKHFDKAVIKDVAILNENVLTRRKWFSLREITDEGATVKKYDGLRVSTAGRYSTTFDMEHHPGAKILPDGSLILKDGVKIDGGNVVKNPNGFRFDNGIVDFSDFDISGITEVELRESSLFFGENEFYSYDGKIEIQEGSVKFSGHVLEYMGEIPYSEMKGDLTMYADRDYFTLHEDSFYTSFIHGRKSTQFSSGDSLLDISVYDGRFDDPKCGDNSCILHNYYSGKMDVFNLKKSKPIIESKDYSITKLSVTEIEDESRIVFKDKSNVELEFSDSDDNPIKYRGDVNTLVTDVYTKVKVDGREVGFQIEDGKVSICESDSCKLQGSFEQLPKKPRKIDSILQINANPSWIPEDDKGNPLYLKSGEKDLEDFFNREYSGNFGYQVVEPREEIPKDPTIAIGLGHSWNGQDSQWGSVGRINFEDFPNSEVIVLGSCHTVQNPEHRYEELGGVDVSSNLPNFEVHLKKGGRFQYQSAEGVIQELQNNNPNLRMIMGYQTSAPAYDEFLKESLSVKSLKVLENQGYEAFMNHNIRLATEIYGRVPDSRGEVSLPARRYSLIPGSEGGEHSSDYLTPSGHREGKRVGFYFRGDDGVWKYYSWDHPDGIALDFPRSHRIYQEEFRESVE